MDFLAKYIHLFIIIYAGYSYYMEYEEFSEKVVIIEQERPGMETKITRYKKQIKEIEVFKKNRDQVKKRVEEVTEQIKKIQKQLPTDVLDTVIMTMLDSEAKSLNIVDPSPSPGREVTHGFYFSKDYNFKGSGTFLQFLVLFERILKTDRLINIKEVKMVADNSGKKGRFQMINMSTNLESYRYNPGHNENSGVREIETKFNVK